MPLQVPLLGLVENMSTYVCPACGHVDQIFGEDGGRRTAAELGLELLAQVILLTCYISICLNSLVLANLKMMTIIDLPFVIGRQHPH